LCSKMQILKYKPRWYTGMTYRGTSNTCLESLLQTKITTVQIANHKKHAHIPSSEHGCLHHNLGSATFDRQDAKIAALLMQHLYARTQPRKCRHTHTHTHTHPQTHTHTQSTHLFLLLYRLKMGRS